MAATLTSMRAAPLIVRRSATAVPPLARRTLAVHAAKEQGEGEPSKALQNQPQQGQPAPATRSGAFALQEGLPTFGRMNQMFSEMEREMNQLSRAFGLPTLATPSLFTDLPASMSAVAELPAMATTKALAVDIKDTENELQITADVPGLSKDDIKVQVSPDRVLSISGERRSEHQEGSEESGNLRIERSYGSFLRRFRLPEGVDVEGIKANTKDGVLRLTVPKTEVAKPKQIDIQVGE